MSDLKESYSKMFSLPRLEIQLVIAVILFVVGLYLSLGAFTPYSILLMFSGPFLVSVLIILPEERRILNAKRLTFLVNLFLLAIDAYLFGHIVLGFDIFAVGVLFVLSLLFIVFAASLDLKVSWLVLFIVFVAELVFVGIAFHELINGQLMFFAKLNVGLFVYLIFLYWVFIRGNRSRLGNTSVSGFEFLKAYLFLHFRDRNDLIEKIFEEASLERDIPVVVSLFVADKPILAIVGAQIHPGPLRNCGSSNFPYILFKEIEHEIGAKTLFLKGAGSHDTNLPSTEYSKIFASKISSFVADLLKSSKPIERVSFPTIIRSGIVSATIFDIGSNRYVMLSSHPEPTDDIDPNLGYMALSLGKLIDKNIFLVDMHNSLTKPEVGKKMNIDDYGYADILDVIVKATKVDSSEEGEVFVGVAQGSCPNIGLLEGLGPLGIVVASFKIGDKLYFIVEYDSNNITPDFHEDVIRIIRDEFKCDLVSVLSTDTHMVTGITHKTMYTILGQLMKDKILECTRNIAREAYSNMKKAKVFIGKTVIRAKVLGVDTHNQMLSIATEGVKASNKLFKVTYILTTLINILLLTLVTL